MTRARFSTAGAIGAARIAEPADVSSHDSRDSAAAGVRAGRAGKPIAVERYTRTAMVLHWVVALAIMGQIAFGWYLQSVPRKTPDRTIYVNYHKSTGMVIGLLILVRLAWRLTHKPPPLPRSMPGWQRRVAGANHVLLYGCMIVMPLAGYTASNFSKFGVKFFNRLTLPPWGVDDQAVYAFFNGLHVATSYLFVALIALHIAAAIKHAVVPGDGILRRMLPL
jgi:cytochrome b561